ncbi:MAG TPA: AI-2E family transporter, partial [Chloroflexota bacterium]|nr:AI-2E family transporter [Chloroflexota bacterium]
MSPRQYLYAALILGVIGFLVWLLVLSWGALLPFQIGAVLAYLLLPIVDRLGRRMPRTLAVGVVFLVSFAAIALAVAFGLPWLIAQIESFFDSMPTAADVDAAFASLRGLALNLPPEQQAWVSDMTAQAVATIRSHLLEWTQNLLAVLTSAVLNIAGVVGFLLGFLIVPFWLFYVLQDEPKGKLAVDRRLPRWLRPDFWAVARIADRVFGGYIRGEVVLCLAMGALVFFGLNFLTLIGVPGIRFTALLAVVAAFTELIPFFGPMLGGIPAVLMGLTHSWQTALAVLALYFVLQQIENSYLAPRILGHALDWHPAVLMVLLIMFGQLGVIWLVLAAPLSALLRDEVRYLAGRLSTPPRPAGWLPAGRGGVLR